MLEIVEQIESLPPEVLELFSFRKEQRNKEEKQQRRQANEKQSQLMDAFSLLKQQQTVQQPVAAPSPQGPSADILAQLLGNDLGGAGQELFI